MMPYKCAFFVYEIVVCAVAMETLLCQALAFDCVLQLNRSNLEGWGNGLRVRQICKSLIKSVAPSKWNTIIYTET